MGLSQLLFATSLLVTTVWAETKTPWVFSVKINETFIPLSGKPMGISFDNMTVFTYGDSENKPPQFFLHKEFVSLISDMELSQQSQPQGQQSQPQGQQQEQRQYVGMKFKQLAFGSSVSPQPLEMNRNWKVLPGPFYSCKSKGDPARWVIHGTTGKGVCSEVDIYFLPYNRETKSVMRPVFNSSNVENLLRSTPGTKELCSIMLNERYFEEIFPFNLVSLDTKCDIYVENELRVKGAVATSGIK